MTITLIGLALFGMLFIGILSVVSNTAATGTTNLENELFLLNCPAPVNGGVVFANQTAIDGFTVTYNVTRDDSDGSEYHLFVFDCEVTDPDAPFYAVSGTTYTSTNDFFATTVNQLGYIYQVISHFLVQAQHFFIILGFIFTPLNFDILGFTFDDLSGISAMLVVLIYIVNYVFIGIWVFKAVSPFSGGSG